MKISLLTLAMSAVCHRDCPLRAVLFPECVSGCGFMTSVHGLSRSQQSSAAPHQPRPVFLEASWGTAFPMALLVGSPKVFGLGQPSHLQVFSKSKGTHSAFAIGKRCGLGEYSLWWAAVIARLEGAPSPEHKWRRAKGANTQMCDTGVPGEVFGLGL